MLLKTVGTIWIEASPWDILLDDGIHLETLEHWIKTIGKVKLAWMTLTKLHEEFITAEIQKQMRSG